MIRSLQIFIIVVITSLYIFPFFPSFIPSLNTKMMLAVLGLFAYFFDRMNGDNFELEKNFLIIFLWALGISLCSYASMIFNNTPDNSYVDYYVSMMVWLFAAYFCVSLMKRKHGKISVEIVGYYLMGVAILQCTLALLINSLPFLKDFFAAIVTGGKSMGEGVEGRLYGPGCAVDVGGGRLGAILIIIVYLMLLSIKRNNNKWIFVCLLTSFLYISIVGNMIGRTASVGFTLALIYLGFSLFFDKEFKSASYKSYLNISLVIISLSVIICIIMYNVDEEMRRLLRFGFEGFFNYFEHGVFETHSTNMLSAGMIFPNNMKTWIIGDGYFASGSNDPYYIGPSDYGFYMNTDAGYSRFIFYFGLIGLSTFILFFINVCRVCIQKTNNVKYLFLFLLILNLGIWVKVSTDLFVVFAPFLCVTLPKNEFLLEKTLDEESKMKEFYS